MHVDISCGIYIGVFKKYVRCRSLPEGSMAKGYIVAETLGYAPRSLEAILHTLMCLG